MYLVLLTMLYLCSTCNNQQVEDRFVCMKKSPESVRKIFVKPRRYDIDHMGRVSYYHGWADVQGQGAANDFCRIVGNSKALLLTCALAGTSGQSDRNYNSAFGFDPGFKDTWYMKDEDGDGRDDYCRCVFIQATNTSQIWCTKAGPNGFYGSTEQRGEELTFSAGDYFECEKQRRNIAFGRIIVN